MAANTLVTNNSLPNIFKNIADKKDTNGVITILISLYGTKPFDIHLAKLKFQISSKFPNGLIIIFVNITKKIPLQNNIFLKLFIKLLTPFYFISYPICAYAAGNGILPLIVLEINPI